MCWPTPPMPARTQNASRHVLTKLIQCQRGQSQYLNMSRPNITHSSLDTKCISTCVDQTNPIPDRTEKASQHVLTKPIPCQLGHKIYLNLCWQRGQKMLQNLCWTKPITWQLGPKIYLNKCSLYLSYASDYNKCISTCVEESLPMPARTENLPQNVLMKLLPCQQGLKMHLNMCWTNTSHVSEQTICISTCVDQTHPMPVSTQNASPHAFTKTCNAK